MTSTTAVAEYGSRFDADLAVAKLDGYGIDAMTRSDPAASIAPHLVTDRVFRVLVRTEMAAEARDLLAEPDPAASELDAHFYVRGFRNRPSWIQRTTLLVLVAFAGPVVLTTVFLTVALLQHLYP